MKTVIKKLIQIIVFLLILASILLINYEIYKHIDKIIPIQQNEIHILDNNLKQEEYNFLYELCIQVEEQEELKKILDNDTIKENYETIYNIIKNYPFRESDDEKCFKKISLYSGELSNTIYGDLKFLINKEFVGKKNSYTNFFIVYSEDMKRICYYNFSWGIEPNDYLIQVKENWASSGYTELTDSDEKANSEEAKNNLTSNKEEITKKVKENFKNINFNIDLKPNIIIKKSYSYILQDEENDITIYYDNENNVIFGFYIGFKN